MLGVTFFGLVFTPVFYWLVMKLAARRPPSVVSMAKAAADSGAGSEIQAVSTEMPEANQNN
jgi:hypothetical protein